MTKDIEKSSTDSTQLEIDFLIIEIQENKLVLRLICMSVTLLNVFEVDN